LRPFTGSIRLNVDPLLSSLCTVIRLAQMLDGRITVQSELSRGSTFSLILPVKGRK